MGFLMPKTPSLPPVQPLPPAPTNKLTPEEEARIAAEQAAIERRRKGRASTILTTDLLNENDQTTVEKKTLLGG
jgi:hypothetical protein